MPATLREAKRILQGLFENQVIALAQIIAYN